MDRKKLLAHLESIQDTHSPKKERERIADSIVESMSLVDYGGFEREGKVFTGYDLGEDMKITPTEVGNIDLEPIKLGAVAPVWNAGFINMNDKEKEYLLSDKVFASSDLGGVRVSSTDIDMVRKSRGTDWKEATPKDHIYVVKSGLQKNLRNITIFAGFGKELITPPKGSPHKKYIFKRFKAPNILKNLYKVPDNGLQPHITPNNVELLNMYPFNVQRVAFYPLKGSRYMVMIELKNDNKLLLFPMSKVSFNLIFDAKI